MHYVGVIFFIGIGGAAIAFAVAHEFYWWKRKAWLPSIGIIKELKEEHWADGGPTYSAVIEFEVNGAIRSFDSQYGSGKKPGIGDRVPIVVSPAGNEAAEISQSHHILIPLAFCVFGVMCVLVGVNIKPIAEIGADQPATAPMSKHEGGAHAKPESEVRSP